MAVPYKLPRGTRAALNSKASGSTIVVGQVYLLTDETRLAVGLTATTYESFAKKSEVDSKMTVADDSATNGAGAVRYDGGVFSSGNATVEGVVTFVKGDGTIPGYLEVATKLFSGGAYLGGALSANGRLKFYTYGTIPAIEFNATPYVNTNAIYHAGNKPTATDVGLGNVDNTTDTAKPVSTAQQAALDLKANLSLVGAASGIASLDSGGLVPTGQLPSYVDDVLEYANLAAFPGTGVSGKIYIAIDTGFTYRWSGSAYALVGPASGVTNFQLTFNNGGSGAASGTTFDGSVARTISYNSIGAVPVGLVTASGLTAAATNRIFGRVTAGAGAAEELTGTQITPLLDVMVGDSGSGGTKGLVPAPGAASAANNLFLKANGAWASTLVAVSVVGGSGVTSNTSIVAGSSTITVKASANSILGNNTGSVAGIIALTGAQITAMLSPAVADGAQGVLIGTDKTKIDNLVAVASSGSASDLTTGTLPAARLPVQGFNLGVTGKGTNGARYPVTAPYAFTATTGNSSAKALVAATASTVYTIKKGTIASPTTVGTFTFAAAGTIATPSITAGSIAAGDTVWIEGPATADVTLADITFLVRA